MLSPDSFFASRVSSSLLLCKSHREASASGAKYRDLQHFVGDASGIMPVCFAAPKSYPMYSFI